jgi:adhesin transport system membrane fusion protein
VIAGSLKPYVEKVLGRLPSKEEGDVRSISRPIPIVAILRQEPLRARVLLRSVGIVMALFILWAAVAQLDEVTRGEGKVIPSKQVQILQSIDGGLVSEILVREGDVVQANQLLIKIDETRFVSSVKENRVQYLGLVARAARLKAMSDGKPFVPPPDVLKDAPDVVAQEFQLYEAKRAEMNAAISIARQQLAQRQQELNEAQARRAQASTGYDLTSKELTVTRR